MVKKLLVSVITAAVMGVGEPPGQSIGAVATSSLVGRWVVENGPGDAKGRMLPQPWGWEFVVVRDEPERLVVAIDGVEREYVLDGKPHQTRGEVEGYSVDMITTGTRVSDRISILMQVLPSKQKGSTTIVHDGDHLTISRELRSGNTVGKNTTARYKRKASG